MQRKELRADERGRSSPSPQENLVQPRKRKQPTEMERRERRRQLTGGAENLKSEDPLRARNFGEYIRS